VTSREGSETYMVGFFFFFFGLVVNKYKGLPLGVGWFVGLGIIQGYFVWGLSGCVVNKYKGLPFGLVGLWAWVFCWVVAFG
jgi:hypothetical protein